MQNILQMMTFDTFFNTATGRPPYPFQRRFAMSPTYRRS